MAFLRKDPAGRLTVLYLVALTSIGLIALVSQLIIRDAIQSQLNDSRVVNLSGRQRMLSQWIAKDLLLLRAAESPDEQAVIAKRLLENAGAFNQAHRMLADQIPSPFVKAPNSPEVIALFRQIQPFYDSLASAVTELLPQANSLSPEQKERALRRTLAAEPRFLVLMDAITLQYEREAVQRVSTLRLIEELLFLCTLVILFLEGLLIFRPLTRWIQRYVKALNEKNTELQNLTQELVESRKALLSSAFEAQEKERSRISMELHDGLGPILALARLNLDQVKALVPETGTSNLSRIYEHLDTISGGIRHLAQEFSYPLLFQDGLVQALENLVHESREVSSANILFHSSQTAFALPDFYTLNVYRIVQELLHNALQHSMSEEIMIQLFVSEGNLVVMLEDDGQGMLQEDPLQADGLGLKNTFSRASALGGRIHIDSESMRGTTVTCYLPLPANHGEANQDTVGG